MRFIFSVLLGLCSLSSFAAELHVPEQFDLLKVNGQEHKTFFQRNKTVALQKGRNEIEMEFNQIYDADGNDSHDRIRSKPFTVVIDVAVDNEVWVLQAEQPATRSEALRYSKEPRYQLQKNGVAMVSSNVAVEAPISKNSNDDALAMLNLWWEKATVEQRQAFLRSVLSKP